MYCAGLIRASAAIVLSLALPVLALAQAGRAGASSPTLTPKASAPIDLTGYWVSLIVDEWRFRVTPQKGDILYLPVNAEARRIANAWDPSKDESEGNQCRAYGAVGVMQRPGRLHIVWDNDTTLKIEADAGTQIRLLHFGPAPSQPVKPAWQGYSVASWELPGGGRRGGLGPFVPSGSGKTGTLKVVTTDMLPGYIRKNGVPYSGNAVLSEWFKTVGGADGQVYLAVTAMVEDPTYLNQPFLRTYTFKKAEDASGWDPTPCWPR